MSVLQPGAAGRVPRVPQLLLALQLFVHGPRPVRMARERGCQRRRAVEDEQCKGIPEPIRHSGRGETVAPLFPAASSQAWSLLGRDALTYTRQQVRCCSPCPQMVSARAFGL